jgi:alpha-tubulin suppressor-like RCC1 family protein
MKHKRANAVGAVFALALWAVWIQGCASAHAASAVIPWGNPGGPEATVPPGLSNVVAVSDGAFFSLALKSDGTIAYLGSNFSDPVSPTNVPPGATNLIAISVRQEHSIALRQDGTVLAWGAGGLNATGIVDHGQSIVPPNLTNATAIAAGSGFSLALKSDGTVVAWGTLSNAPPGLSNVTAIAAGGVHALALRNDGTVAVWRNEEAYNGVITNIPPGLTNVTAIAAGGSFSLVLLSDGTVTGWGFNDYGQLSVPPGLSNVVGISCGEFQSLAIRQDHTVVAWGAGGSGSNSWPNYGQAIVPFGLTNVSAVSGGYFSSLSINDGSPVLATLPVSQTNFTGTTVSFTATVAGLPPFDLHWQHNGTNIPDATSLTLTLTNIRLPDAGSYHLVVSNPYGSIVSPDASLTVVTSAPIILQQPVSQAVLVTSNCAFSILSSGSLPIGYQWRFNGTNLATATGSALGFSNVQFSASGPYDCVLSNSFGSITSSVATLAVTPSIVVGWGSGAFGKTNHPAALTNVIAIAAGYSHSLALQSNGVVVAWGGNGSGQTNVPPDLTNAVAIASGADFCVALRSDGRVAAWGDNAWGQTNVPPGLSNVVAISAGDYHALALKRDGTLAGWGYFIVFDRVIKVPFWIPAGISNVISVATGSEHGMALKSNGKVVAWGYNFTPGLTNPPASLSNVVAIAAGAQHCLALRKDGKVFALGDTEYGETNVPPGLSNVVAIAAGSYHSIALKSDGTVVAWGVGTNSGSYPAAGQSLVPPGLRNVTAIAGGDTHTLAVRDLLPRAMMPDQLTKSNATFSFRFFGLNSHVYSLETLDSLSQSNWVFVGLSAGIGDEILLTDPGATNAQRFYRVRKW